MSINPIEAIGAVQSIYSAITIPTQDSTGFVNVHRTEQLDMDGRTISVTEVALITYDRFGNLQTIPSPHTNTTMDMQK